MDKKQWIDYNSKIMKKLDPNQTYSSDTEKYGKLRRRELVDQFNILINSSSRNNSYALGKFIENLINRVSGYEMFILGLNSIAKIGNVPAERRNKAFVASLKKYIAMFINDNSKI